MESCHICDEQQGRVPVPGGTIYEDDLVYANHIYDDSAPTYLGYLMAEPRRHAPGWADLTDAEAERLVQSKSRHLELEGAYDRMKYEPTTICTAAKPG